MLAKQNVRLFLLIELLGALYITLTETEPFLSFNLSEDIVGCGGSSAMGTDVCVSSLEKGSL